MIIIINKKIIIYYFHFLSALYAYYMSVVRGVHKSVGPNRSAKTLPLNSQPVEFQYSYYFNIFKNKNLINICRRCIINIHIKN